MGKQLEIDYTPSKLVPGPGTYQQIPMISRPLILSNTLNAPNCTFNPLTSKKFETEKSKIFNLSLKITWGRTIQCKSLHQTC